MLTPLAKTIYTAPELCLISDLGYTEKIDIWSCGVLLLESFAKQKPFKKTTKFILLTYNTIVVLKN